MYTPPSFPLQPLHTKITRNLGPRNLAVVFTSHSGDLCLCKGVGKNSYLWSEHSEWLKQEDHEFVTILAI